jgi:hypothetical protein
LYDCKFESACFGKQLFHTDEIITGSKQSLSVRGMQASQSEGKQA